MTTVGIEHEGESRRARASLIEWLTTTNHKQIGILYISTSLLFFIGGGILAMLMRGQLATPNEHFITRDSYNALFTIHGTAMMLLFATPMVSAETASGITAMNVPTPSGRPTKRTVISLVTPNVPSLPTNSAVRS